MSINQPEWNYTIDARDKLGETYGGRHIIGRDTPIRGGVFVGAGTTKGSAHGEAIVVDPDKHPEQYQRYYEKVMSKSYSRGGMDEARVIRAIYDVVHKQMHYSREGVRELLQAMAEEAGYDPTVVDEGQKVELSTLMEAGIGVCSHQALACGALYEMAGDERRVRGSISVDSNIMWNALGGRSGHAWARQTPPEPDRDVMVLDVAQHYYGRLQDSIQRAKWNYLRPEELAAMQANLGRVASGHI